MRRFLVAGLLAHQHQRGSDRAFAPHRLRGQGAERALATSAGDLPLLLPSLFALLQLGRGAGSGVSVASARCASLRLSISMLRSSAAPSCAFRMLPICSRLKPSSLSAVMP
jgi:hypothetical protein